MSNEITTNKDIIISNIVPLETLRSVQLSVIEQIANILQNTYGPNGSDTLIIKGSTPDSTSVTYSKDGHTVLKNIKYAYAIETSIQSELEEITRYMEKEVAVETVIEAINGTDERMIYEGSDLIYHLIVLLTSKGYRIEDLARELQVRHSDSWTKH